MRAPSFKRIAEAEAALQADILWTITKGPGWSPSHGAIWSDGKFQPHTRCGICAIGSHVLRHCRGRKAVGLVKKWTIFAGFTRDVLVAAASLRLPPEFVDVIYHAVMTPPAERNDAHDENSVARQLGWRLRDYGDTCLRLQEMAKVAQLRGLDYRETFTV